MTFTITTLPGGVGVEVAGLGRDRGIAPETAAALRRVWLDAGVVVFRGLGTAPEVQLELSRCFGALEPHPIEKLRLHGYPDLILLSNKDNAIAPVYYFDGVATYGRLPWHTDLVYTTTPNAGAILRMVEPPATGGQTGWINMARAYAALEPAMQERIQGLEGVFRFVGDIGEMRFNHPGGVPAQASTTEYPDFPDVAHPLVWVHPETGRRALNLSTLNIRGIVGMDDAEGDPLLQQLIDHALKPEFQYIHDWAPNDMVLWDNRCTMHSAAGHPVAQIRTVHRTTIKGTIAMGRTLDRTTAEHETPESNLVSPGAVETAPGDPRGESRFSPLETPSR